MTELQDQLDRMQDYNRMQNELKILKGIEFDSDLLEKQYSLEKLLSEKNKRLLTEMTAVKVHFLFKVWL